MGNGAQAFCIRGKLLKEVFANHSSQSYMNTILFARLGRKLPFFLCKLITEPAFPQPECGISCCRIRNASTPTTASPGFFNSLLGLLFLLATHRSWQKLTSAKFAAGIKDIERDRAYLLGSLQRL